MAAANIEELWRGELLQSFEHYHYLLREALTTCRAELPAYLRKVLLSRRDTPLALSLVEKLNTDEKKLVFPSLVQLATHTVPHTGTARDLISALPRDWVLQHINQETGEILERTDPEECRRILELYAELDQRLLENACKKLISSGSAELQALGKDFMK